MKLLVVMDEISDMNPDTDSTIEIMRECAKKNITTWYATTDDLFFSSEGVQCTATEVHVSSDKKIEKKEPCLVSLDDFDLVLMRKEPPYDLNYHYVTMLLDKASVPVLNNPQGLRNANEKLVVMNFPQLLPPTLVTNQVGKIEEFIEQHKKIVLKPIHEFGGRNIEKIEADDSNRTDKINNVLHNGKNYGLAQAFIEKVYEGDKRIFLLNGEFLGVVKRVPQGGDFRANMVIGGKAEKTELSADDKNIIQTVGHYLKTQGLVLAGVDVIDGKLIEINVTCPTGLVPINKLYEQNVTERIVKFLTQKTNRI